MCRIAWREAPVWDFSKRFLHCVQQADVNLWTGWSRETGEAETAVQLKCRGPVVKGPDLHKQACAGIQKSHSWIGLCHSDQHADSSEHRARQRASARGKWLDSSTKMLSCGLKCFSKRMCHQYSGCGLDCVCGPLKLCRRFTNTSWHECTEYRLSHCSYHLTMTTDSNQGNFLSLCPLNESALTETNRT